MFCSEAGEFIVFRFELFFEIIRTFSCPSRVCSEGVRPVDSMYLPRAFSHRSSKSCLVDMCGSRVRGMNSYAIELILVDSIDFYRPSG